MIRRKLLHAACLAFVVVVYLPAGKMSVQAQDGNRFSIPIEMWIDGDTDETRQRTSHSGIIDAIGVFRNEQIGITLILPSSRIDYSVGVTPLDGGEIVGSENLTVARDGTVHFTFQAGDTPGLYRVLAIIRSEQYQLQFYVSRSQTDGCTPP